jgi:hypothetical protein
MEPIINTDVTSPAFDIDTTAPPALDNILDNIQVDDLPFPGGIDDGKRTGPFTCEHKIYLEGFQDGFNVARVDGKSMIFVRDVAEKMEMVHPVEVTDDMILAEGGIPEAAQARVYVKRVNVRIPLILHGRLHSLTRMTQSIYWYFVNKGRKSTGRLEGIQPFSLKSKIERAKTLKQCYSQLFYTSLNLKQVATELRNQYSSKNPGVHAQNRISDLHAKTSGQKIKNPLAWVKWRALAVTQTFENETNLDRLEQARALYDSQFIVEKLLEQDPIAEENEYTTSESNSPPTPSTPTLNRDASISDPPALNSVALLSSSSSSLAGPIRRRKLKQPAHRKECVSSLCSMCSPLTPHV